MDACPDALYEALVSRDRRFDGRFFAGVVSTGVYCRPGCPAPSPKRENVRFFRHAAAAEAAGFRACRRCRPETAPGSSAWEGTSTTVSRALRLIGDGALDGASVDELASRLGVGARHLRRLFEEHVGASPLRVAHSRRLHFARRLVDETSLPLSEVATAAGFGSVRRFNAAVRAGFGAPASALRGRARRGLRPAADGGIRLRLPYRPPHDWDALLGYLRTRAVTGVEQVEGTTYRRTASIDGATGLLEVRPDHDAPHVSLCVSSSLRLSLLEITSRTRRLLGLDADPSRIDAHLSRDAALAPGVRRRPGVRVPGAWDPFELAVRAILGQQVSVAGATTLAGRLAARFGRSLEGAAAVSGAPDRLFPGPDALVDAPVEQVGLPRARGAAVRELARRVLAGEVDLAGEPERAREQLTAIPGVGEWTAEYVAMRALGDPDAFLCGDLGVRRALAPREGPLPPARAVRERAEAWRPWRAHAVVHLWLSPAGSAPASRRAGPRPR